MLILRQNIEAADLNCQSVTYWRYRRDRNSFGQKYGSIIYLDRSVGVNSVEIYQGLFCRYFIAGHLNNSVPDCNSKRR